MSNRQAARARSACASTGVTVAAAEVPVLSQCILAIDQGTTGTTVLVIDANGRIRGRPYGLVRQYYPQPGWVEHDAEQIYRSVVKLGREAIAKEPLRPGDLAPVAITT